MISVAFTNALNFYLDWFIVSGCQRVPLLLWGRLLIPVRRVPLCLSRHRVIVVGLSIGVLGSLPVRWQANTLLLRWWR